MKSEHLILPILAYCLETKSYTEIFSVVHEVIYEIKICLCRLKNSSKIPK